MEYILVDLIIYLEQKKVSIFSDVLQLFYACLFGFHTDI